MERRSCMRRRLGAAENRCRWKRGSEWQRCSLCDNGMAEMDAVTRDGE